MQGIARSHAGQANLSAFLQTSNARCFFEFFAGKAHFRSLRGVLGQNHFLATMNEQETLSAF